MNRKILGPLVALVAFAILTGIAEAQIKTTITVQDSDENVMSSTEAVRIGTEAHVYGHYEDFAGSSQASGNMDVYFDDGSGLKYKATIWSGILNDGDTVAGTPYTMNELGTYEFRFTCQIGTPETLAILRCDERAQARTTIQLVVPEPGTLAGLAMALAAFGFLTVKKAHTKITR